ncbi:MAG: RidA family protein, partial [Pelagibacteraceae bacterium]
AYVAFRIVNKLVYISGQVSFDQNGNLIKGKVGSELSLEQGQEAAKACAINIISQLKSACDGDLEKVKSCIKINGYVNSTDNFLDQPKVINAASELIVNVFGEKGKHARAAVSVNSLPLGAAVEIESIFEIN